MTDPLRVLVVCTANICRSPAAEAYLRHHAAQRGIAIEVSSSGFLWDGESASDVMATVMGERGFDLSAHRSRISSCEMIDQADLVVTMERHHGRNLGARCGPRKIFTLKGAVASLAALEGDFDGPLERIAAAEEGRQHGDLLGDGPDEVADPHGRPARVNRKTADELRDLTAELLELLFPTAENAA
ncbi:MAG: hypothetical protein AAGE98_22205 [Actinomycetota bacterium]